MIQNGQPVQVLQNGNGNPRTLTQKCPKLTNRRGLSITYNDIFMEDVEKLREAANVIISIEEILSEAETSLKSTT